jgi:uncharacterized membrane protein
VPDFILSGLILLTQILEICGAGFLILGFIFDTSRWFQNMRQQEPLAARGRYRQSLGRSVLIGLEILVASTIIKTIIVEPSMEGLGILAAMVTIRVMLGWTTVLEISGRWPWQRG